MNYNRLKAGLVGLLIIWLLLFLVDSMFGITWPNYTIHRLFVWTPTILIAVYWLVFGGSKKDKAEK